MDVLEDYGELAFALNLERISHFGRSKHISDDFSRRRIAAQVASAPVGGGVCDAHPFDPARVIGRYGHALNRHGNLRGAPFLGCTRRGIGDVTSNAPALG